MTCSSQRIRAVSFLRHFRFRGNDEALFSMRVFMNRLVLVMLVLGLPIAASAEEQELEEAVSVLVRDLEGPITEMLPNESLLLVNTGDASCDVVVDALSDALVEIGISVSDRAAFEAMVAESQLHALGSDEVSEMAGAYGAGGVLQVSCRQLGGEQHVTAKLVRGATAEIVASASASFLARDAAGPALPAAVESGDLQTQLRRLSDRLRNGFDRQEGELRYQKVAVLPFSEGGPAVSEKQLGLLVSAELTTLLSRDHGIMMVERAQLSRIIEELSLSQTGLVDPAQSVEVGRLAGAQLLLMGSVSAAGEQYLVNARVVSVKNGEVVLAEKASLPAADLVALSSKAVVLRTRMGAVFRSSLLPGWGQLYNQQPTKSALFAGVELAAVGGALVLHMLASQSESEFSSLGAGSTRFRELENRTVNRKQWRNRLIYGAIAVHLFNVLDAYLSGHTYESATGE